MLFTMTVNLPTDNPDKAFGWMAYTALRQDEIKRAAGAVATGRKLVNSVYSYSLAWAPDETPTKEEMLEAAFASMHKLGLASHEAVLIAHNDTPHPHIHIIANRVHPATGLAAPLSKDHLVLSEWAEAYEKAQGLIRIQRRVDNNEERRRGRFMKDKDSDDTAAYRRWQKQRERAAEEQRRRQQQDLTEAQKRERDELERKARDEIETLRKTQKEVQRADWTDLYKQQKKERDAFEKAQQTPFGRLRYWLNNREIDRWGQAGEERPAMVTRAFQVLSDGNIMRDQVAAKEVRERRELAVKLKAMTETKIKPLAAQHDQARKELADRQLAARQEQTRTQQQQRDGQARIARQGNDRSAFEFDQAAKGVVPKKEPERNFLDRIGERSPKGKDVSAGFEQAAKDAAPKNDPQRSFLDRIGERQRTPDQSPSPADKDPAAQPENKPAPEVPPTDDPNIYGQRDKGQSTTRNDDSPNQKPDTADDFKVERGDKGLGRGGPSRDD
ncbi:relaxase/mobilization nuclease domain-containing protein [Arvimicrobium flavum]|uniref:relaxase/mobilization nuclease domain-containing protein n=1 Tax=Arvimicrobium flavum TaxID=3393320 RepID=UPI00237C5138|nr:relaxase/mobilization nuclease domain-containing protein [Mesorhizobium shangrilense]